MTPPSLTPGVLVGQRFSSLRGDCPALADWFALGRDPLPCLPFPPASWETYFLTHFLPAGTAHWGPVPHIPDAGAGPAQLWRSGVRYAPVLLGRTDWSSLSLTRPVHMLFTCPETRGVSVEELGANPEKQSFQCNGIRNYSRGQDEGQVRWAGPTCCRAEGGFLGDITLSRGVLGEQDPRRGDSELAVLQNPLYSAVGAVPCPGVCTNPHCAHAHTLTHLCAH